MAMTFAVIKSRYKVKDVLSFLLTVRYEITLVAIYLMYQVLEYINHITASDEIKFEIMTHRVKCIIW